MIDYFEGRLAFGRGESEAAARALDRALAGDLPPRIASHARAMLVELRTPPGR